jgi:hypothetical protein
MQNRVRTFSVVALAAIGALSAAGLSGCSSASEAPQQKAENAQDIRRTPDGKPDFTGVWAGPGFRHTGKETDSATVRLYTNAKMAPIKPEGKSLLLRAHTGDVRIDDPTAVCLPNGLTRQIPSPYAQQWIHTPDQLVILYEYMHFFRVIPFGAPNRAHAEDIEPTYMGDSIAWWDGDTLVIDTVRLNRWLLDAYHPEDGGSRWHSDQAHVVERITFTDRLNASYDVTIDDPAIFTAPWVENWSMQVKPTWKIFEFVCDDNDRCRAGKCTDSDAQKTSTQ